MDQVQRDRELAQGYLGSKSPASFFLPPWPSSVLPDILFGRCRETRGARTECHAGAANSHTLLASLLILELPHVIYKNLIRTYDFSASPSW